MTRRRTRTPRPPQADLPFGTGHGGARRGAGRKPKGLQPLVAHTRRAALPARHPVHVTVKLRQGLPKLRQPHERAALLATFARAKQRAGRTGKAFRLTHFAILNDHLHLIVEAQDREALARAVQGLLIRVARALNKLWQRHGSLFADRYHDRALTTPRAVRNALCYVLANGKKHAAEGRAVTVPQAIDVYTSAPWFDGFVEPITVRGIAALPPPVAAPRTWLLTIGWRRRGLLSAHELPASA
ncbi:MAG: transposase [Planctomycetes bacterium]|nr:transposase [Planctomycetota bacterium]